MYSCPTDDIHSIYLDNELPVSYIQEYESHLKSCAKCRAKLESMRKIKDALKEDCRSINLSKPYMEQSFERLQTKMHYSKNVVHEFKLPVSEKTLRWSMGACAAVVVAAILPFTISNSSKAKSDTLASITPVARPQNTPIARQNVVITGNLNSNMAQTVSTGRNSYSSLPDVDVLRPDFDDSRNFKFKITVPGLNDEEIQTFEFNLPENMYEGQLEWNRHHR